MTRTKTRPCPNCFAPMELIEASHIYGQEVEIDACLTCHILFFDKNEHRGLSAQSTLALIERFQAEPLCQQPAPTHPPICADCGGDQTLVARQRHTGVECLVERDQQPEQQERHRDRQAGEDRARLASPESRLAQSSRPWRGESWCDCSSRDCRTTG